MGHSHREAEDCLKFSFGYYVIAPRHSRNLFPPAALNNIFREHAASNRYNGAFKVAKAAIARAICPWECHVSAGYFHSGHFISPYVPARRVGIFTFHLPAQRSVISAKPER